MSVTSVLVVDDHPFVRKSLAADADDLGLKLLAQVADPAEALEAIKQHKPQVIVVDISLGEGRMSGLDLITEILHEIPKARIVVWSQHTQIELVAEAYRNGVLAYVVKDMAVEALGLAIQRVASTGARYYHDGLAEKIANMHSAGVRSPRELLDERHLKIFQLVAANLRQEEIAEKLGMSVRTVSTAMGHIRDVLRVRNQGEYFHLALKYKLLDNYDGPAY